MGSALSGGCNRHWRGRARHRTISQGARHLVQHLPRSAARARLPLAERLRGFLYRQRRRGRIHQPCALRRASVPSHGELCQHVLARRPRHARGVLAATRHARAARLPPAPPAPRGCQMHRSVQLDGAARLSRLLGRRAYRRRSHERARVPPRRVLARLRDLHTVRIPDNLLSVTALLHPRRCCADPVPRIAQGAGLPPLALDALLASQLADRLAARVGGQLSVWCATGHRSPQLHLLAGVQGGELATCLSARAVHLDVLRPAHAQRALVGTICRAHLSADQIFGPHSYRVLAHANRLHLCLHDEPGQARRARGRHGPAAMAMPEHGKCGSGSARQRNRRAAVHSHAGCGGAGGPGIRATSFDIANG
mmetsp:Transcript_7833/g.24447  ORF Transcript_7833/g.24447 Transcript_7833/m.24447 type:complete len:366 (+) Transcript_7833:332-1429(+)